MDSPAITNFITMDQASFNRLSSYVTAEYGIKLPISKKSMLESRLFKKIKQLGHTTYAEFLDFLFSEKGLATEMHQVIDLITTNKTDFFREPLHFHYLTNELLPSFTTHDQNRHLNIWSAGCSTGEEPYTILMVLEEFSMKSPLSYSLLGSDLSTRVLQYAYDGIYDISKIEPVPIEMKRRYFNRSKTNPGLVRVKPEFRKKLTLKHLNFMHNNLGLPVQYFDVIFCRNVLIYFDKETQERVIRQFCRHLRHGGYLFLGHSESIIGMNLPLRQVKPTIYKHIG